MNTKQPPSMATHYCKHLDAYYHADAVNVENKAGMWSEADRMWKESAVSNFEVLNCPDRFKQVYLNQNRVNSHNQKRTPSEYTDRSEEDDYNADGVCSGS